MISAVESWVNKRLTKVRIDGVRKRSYESNITNYHIRKYRTTVMLNNAFVDVGIPGPTAKAMADASWNNIYTSAKIKRAFRKYFPKGLKLAVSQKSTPQHIIIKMGAGVYGETRKSQKLMTKNGVSTSNQKLVNAAMQDLWGQAMGEAVRVYNKLSGDTKARKDMPKHRGQGNHGELGKVDSTGLKSADQSTIAMVSVGENFDREMEDVLVNLSDQYPSKLREVEQVVKHYADSFEREYKISDKQKFTEKGFERSIGIDIFYGSAADNEDKDIGRADVPGIREFMKEERARIIKEMNPDLIEMLDLEGSKTPRKKLDAIIPAMIIQNIFPHKTRPDMRLRVNKKLVKLGEKSKGKSNKTTTLKQEIMKATKKVVAAKVGSKKRGKTQRGEAGAKTSQSPIALRNLLNEMLPQMVASKMTSPALQFRTGRFANSARVENVNIGPRGGTHIDYTYMRNPYETFEPGNKQGSTQRDPRKIIGASIRELAMGILGRQPTTIRRN